MEAHLLLRYFKKGPEPAKPTIGRPPQPIKCKRMLSGENKECEVPRNVIAREVYRRLTPDPAPGSDLVVFDSDERRRSLRRRNLAKAVRETADFFSISQNVARDCFEPHCDDLLLFGEAIGYS
ncbi:hypothetical protein [Rhizobium sp. BK068]|uniref:hypothetical protein n=1 Tax=Rhizobium sp. BK068 TaxID=2512130 RepID=UPI001047AB1B|nr:hypothetical protein [Rhizobium sp. BK068]